jgi:hypothetical protein
MMETADFRQRYDLAHGGRLDGAGFRRVLPQGQVRSRTVIVGDHNEDAIGGRAGNALRVGEAYTRESGMRTNYLFCLCLIMDSIACGRAELESPNLTGGAIASVGGTQNTGGRSATGGASFVGGMGAHAGPTTSVAASGRVASPTRTRPCCARAHSRLPRTQQRHVENHGGMFDPGAMT